MRITLPGNTIRTEQDLHRMLAEKLDFGPYYGNNLAALWDRMTTDVERPIELIWKDAEKSKAAIGEELFDRIVRLFRDVEALDKELHQGDVFELVLE